MNEKCVGGYCHCGNIFSCKGNSRGQYCDAANSLCKCAKLDNGAVVSESAACNINGEVCDTNDGMCKCGGAASCSKVEGETCVNGVCKCGTADSCHGNKMAPYCDATNNQCKCSPFIPACIDSAECSIPNDDITKAKCNCGTGDSCAGSAHAPYCDSLSANEHICKCSPDVDACTDLKTCGGLTTCQCNKYVFVENTRSITLYY